MIRYVRRASSRASATDVSSRPAGSRRPRRARRRCPCPSRSPRRPRPAPERRSGRRPRRPPCGACAGAAATSSTLPSGNTSASHRVHAHLRRRSPRRCPTVTGHHRDARGPARAAARSSPAASGLTGRPRRRARRGCRRARPRTACAPAPRAAVGASDTPPAAPRPSDAHLVAVDRRRRSGARARPGGRSPSGTVEPRARAPSTTARAIGCSDPASAAAASAERLVLREPVHRHDRRRASSRPR